MDQRLPNSTSRITRRALAFVAGGLLLAPGLPGPAAARRRRPKTKVVTKTFVNDAAITIDGAGPSSAWPSTIRVSGFAQGKLQDVNLIIRGISHEYPGDIDMLLQAPNGRKAKVWSDAGDSQAAVLNGSLITLDDQAAGPLPQNTGFGTGSFQPADYNGFIPGATDPNFAEAGGPGDTSNVRLATFNGIDPNGTWRLWITDDLSGDAGSVDFGWELRIRAKVRR